MKTWIPGVLFGLLAATGSPSSAAVDSRPSFDVEFKRIEFPQGKPDRSQAGVSVEDILSDEEIAVLWELRTALLEHRFLGATVTGYADDHECQADVCRELSLRRASLVLAWLLKHGVPDVQLRGPASESTDFPLNPGETEDDRARNRRVQLLPFVVPGSLPGGH